MKSTNTFTIYEKCTFFEKPEEREYIKQKENDHLQYLVTGIKIDRPEPPKEYFYCETARSSEFMCGLEGKKFEPKTIESLE